MRATVKSTVLAVMVACFGLWGCDSSTEPGLDGSVQLWIASGQGAASIASDRGIPLTVGRDIVLQDDEHTLEITRVAIVLREIELERLSDDDCEDAPNAEDDDCEEFEIGPTLLELPLDGSLGAVVSADVPPGTYDELEFEIHKPESDGDDEAILSQHPEFDGVSIRVEGVFDGEDFVFLQDLDAEQEVDLFPPLVVEEGGDAVDLTLRIDVTGWFVRGDGRLVDPRLANKGQAYEELVEDNIEDSIEVFEDEDRDGERDDD